MIIISYGSTNTSAAVLYCYPVCYDNILVMIMMTMTRMMCYVVQRRSDEHVGRCDFHP